MDLKNNSIMGKLPISEIIRENQLPLAIMSFTHSYFIKHPCYSWQNNPHGSNSTIMNNVDATYRHLIAHNMGKLIDVDGLPHIFGVLCRLEMLTTGVYRNEIATNLTLQCKTSKESPHETDNVFAYQSTPEVYLSLTKTKFYKEQMKYISYTSYPAILMLLEKFATNNINKIDDNHLFDTVFEIDELLFHGIKYCLSNLKGMTDVDLSQHPEFIQNKYNFILNLSRKTGYLSETML